MFEFKFENLDEFIKLLTETPEVEFDAAKQGLEDIKDKWLRKSRNVTPLDKGTLRRSEHADVDKQKMEVSLHANAIEVSKKTGKKFNYGWWLHNSPEGLASTLHTPGTIHKFVDEPLEQNQEKWIKSVERMIKKDLKGKGW